MSLSKDDKSYLLKWGGLMFVAIVVLVYVFVTSR
jgi:cytochrome oxidase assembly protein ShyY1